MLFRTPGVGRRAYRGCTEVYSPDQLVHRRAHPVQFLQVVVLFLTGEVEIVARPRDLLKRTLQHFLDERLSGIPCLLLDLSRYSVEFRPDFLACLQRLPFPASPRLFAP